MAQGTRVRWMRAVVAGLGVTFSTGLVGCMNGDKPKETKSTTPKAGLPGTPTLPAGNPGGAAQAKWTPNGGQFAGPGGNIQPNNFATGAPPRTGTNNLNTSAGANPYGLQPAGAPGVIGAPAQPGVQPSVLPAGGWPGGPVGAAPFTPAGGAVAGYGPASPPPPDLIAPPPPPASPVGKEFANVGGALPSGIEPIAPPIPPRTPGDNRQVFTSSQGVFGSK